MNQKSVHAMTDAEIDEITTRGIQPKSAEESEKEDRIAICTMFQLPYSKYAHMETGQIMRIGSLIQEKSKPGYIPPCCPNCNSELNLSEILESIRSQSKKEISKTDNM